MEKECENIWLCCDGGVEELIYLYRGDTNFIEIHKVCGKFDKHSRENSCVSQESL